MSSHGHTAKRKGGHDQKHRPLTRSNKIINPNRTIALGGNKSGASGKKKVTHLRDNATIQRIAMYKDKPIRNAKGEFMSGAYMSRTPDAPVMRIAPDRRWFGQSMQRAAYIRICSNSAGRGVAWRCSEATLLESVH